MQSQLIPSQLDNFTTVQIDYRLVYVIRDCTKLNKGFIAYPYSYNPIQNYYFPATKYKDCAELHADTLDVLKAKCIDVKISRVITLDLTKLTVVSLANLNVDRVYQVLTSNDEQYALRRVGLKEYKLRDLKTKIEKIHKNKTLSQIILDLES